MAEIENEQLTPELQRIKAETEAKPGFAEWKKNFDLQYGDVPLAPSDLQRKVNPETLDPELQRFKAKYENGQVIEQAQTQQQPETQSTETTDTQEPTYSPLWDTPEAEALTSYQKVYGGDDYFQRANDDMETIFVDFALNYVKEQGGSEQAKKDVMEYVEQMQRRLGNHPLNAHFLRYHAKRAKAFWK